MAAVVTFGEIMLRLAPEGMDRFVQADSFGAVYGGGEANVAGSLAGYGVGARYVTKVPAPEIGQAAVNAMRRYGVDTGYMVRGGDRLGIYFLERGASQRPAKVIYDRKGSAMALAQPSDFNWEMIFDGANWFHFSGITPAIGKNLAQITENAAAMAHQKGMMVSCDLNYRSKMWTLEEAKVVMAGLMGNVDVLITNEMHAQQLLEADVSGYPTEDTNLGQEGCAALGRSLSERYGFRTVAITQRRSLSADDNRFKAAIYSKGEIAFSTQYTMHMVDRVGSGDAFTAGVIYGMKEGLSLQQTVDFAAAACCLKHTINGDVNLMSTAEVWELASGSGSGSVQR